MSVRALSHVAVGVRDMDRSLAFYRDVVGLAVTSDRVEEFAQGAEQAPAQRRAVYLRWGDGPHSSYVVLGGGRAVGSEWLGEPEGGRPVRSAMLRDPEGNHVQLDQRV